MIGFKLWGHFAAFRDPITITQNLTLPIPPKTTIGGLMAAVLGIDYNDYFNDNRYFDFQYSLISLNPIRKKSFAQNYIEDYTKKRSGQKLDSMYKFYLNNNDKKLFDLLNLKFSEKFTKPKPIYRELLINPSFLIFIKDYKY